MERIGRYRILCELGHGAMGVVYHATDPSIGRSVAIKTIRICDIKDAQLREKVRADLFREARSAGVLSHPNIVAIYDMDEAEGIAWVAMAYVNGPTLERIIASEAPLSGANMLRILRQTASALDHAHSRGIFHRDLKPANIMTDEDGAVKVTGFGIAKIAGLESIEPASGAAGVPSYMSPEQLQGLRVEGPSDQFSLAVMAYEILSGERPFAGEGLTSVTDQIIAEPPAEAHLINSTLTPRIDEVLRRGLAKMPADRFPNCSTFVGALEMACAESRGWATAKQAASSELDPSAQPFPVAVSEAPPPPGKIGNSSSPSRLPLLLLSASILLAAAGFVIWNATRHQGRTPQLVSLSPDRQIAQSRATSVSRASRATPPPAQIGPASDSQPRPVPAAQPAAAVLSQLPDHTPPGPLLAPAPIVQPGPPPRNPERQPGIGFRVPSPSVQDVWITTNPAGARAALDDDTAQICQTPCMLRAASGVHRVLISLAGYQTEARDIHVGDTALDLPAVSLRQPSGTLMLTTSPPGAAVRINGQLMEQTTPAQITLRPGSYSITVEKSGRSETQRVDVHESPVYLRIPLAR